ncbi:ubiquitin-like domain-containing protein, partial [Nocardia gipuzkoensis]
KLCLVIAVAIGASPSIAIATAQPSNVQPAQPETARQLTLYIRPIGVPRSTPWGAKLPQDREFTIVAAPSDTIAAVKKKIEAEYTIPPDLQHLLLDGSELADNRSLSSYNISTDPHLLLKVY